MKKSIRRLALGMALAALCSLTAAAGTAATNRAGNVTATPLTENCEVAFPDVQDPGQRGKLTLTYTDVRIRKDDEVLVLLVRQEAGQAAEQTVPSEDSIAYIEQVSVTAETAGRVTFSLYPKAFSDSVVRLYGANIGSVTAAEVKVTYLLGDVDGDGEVTANDALRILRYVANPNKYPLTSPEETANVDGDEEITANDALRVLRYVANPTKYPLEKLQ